MKRPVIVASVLALGALAVLALRSPFRMGVEFDHTLERHLEARLSRLSPNAKDVLLIVVEDEASFQSAYMRFLARFGAKATFASIRNPGGLHVLIEGLNEPLSQREVGQIRKFAEDRGDRVNSLIQVEARVGPDGATPLVVASKNPMKGYDEHGKLQPPADSVSTTVIFPTNAQAREAFDYIDTASYRCSISEVRPGGPMRLEARLIPIFPYYDHGGEWDAFDKLAKRFGGKVEFVSHHFTN